MPILTMDRKSSAVFCILLFFCFPFTITVYLFSEVLEVSNLFYFVIIYANLYYVWFSRYHYLCLSPFISVQRSIIGYFAGCHYYDVACQNTGRYFYSFHVFGLLSRFFMTIPSIFQVISGVKCLCLLLALYYYVAVIFMYLLNDSSQFITDTFIFEIVPIAFCVIPYPILFLMSMNAKIY